MNGPVEIREPAPSAPIQPDFAVPQLLPPPPKAAGFGGTVAVHIALAALFLFFDALPTPEPPDSTISVGVQDVTPLVAPPPSRPLTLPELMAQRRPTPQGTPAPASPAPPAPAAVKPFSVPTPRPAAQPAPIITDAPALPAPQEAPANIFGNTPTAVAPPVIQATEQASRATPQENPKLAFETPTAQASTGRAPTGAVPMPSSTSIAELGQSMARQRGSGGVSVGDIIDSPGASGNPTLSTPNRQSAVQVLGDTMGVDFKPYLVTVLASVRRNWLAVIPESARLGRRGRVQVQLAISRDGSVPKLVISSGSGAEALDRAAVAGISASNPFPPLPPEFKGQQIRLQFTFAYNAQ